MRKKLKKALPCPRRLLSFWDALEVGVADKCPIRAAAAKRRLLYVHFDQIRQSTVWVLECRADPRPVPRGSIVRTTSRSSSDNGWMVTVFVCMLPCPSSPWFFAEPISSVIIYPHRSRTIRFSEVLLAWLLN